jgi:Phage integrase, N-terminal SAM-like domain
MRAALDGFERHLGAERGLSPHTVRAYIGDVRSLLEHAAGDDITAPDRLDIAVLRRWLASQYRTGHARATLARRAAAARTFTAWACAGGWLSRDPGPLLGTAKVRRRLPQMPRQDQMAAVLSAAGSGRGGSGHHGAPDGSRSCPHQCHPPRAMAVGAPPEPSPVADCGPLADAGDLAGRAAGFCASDGPVAGLAGCADGCAGVGAAPTALPKGATGG